MRHLDGTHRASCGLLLQLIISHGPIQSVLSLIFINFFGGLSFSWNVIVAASKPQKPILRFKTSKYFYRNLFRTDNTTKCLKITKGLLPHVIIGFTAWGSEFIFLGSKVEFTSLLSADDFIYPKILFHPFEKEIMLFQIKVAVFAKAMYQTAFLALENRQQFGAPSSCREWPDFKMSLNIYFLIKSRYNH